MRERMQHDDIREREDKIKFEAIILSRDFRSPFLILLARVTSSWAVKRGVFEIACMYENMASRSLDANVLRESERLDSTIPRGTELVRTLLFFLTVFVGSIDAT